jgi:hypothetical protein
LNTPQHGHAHRVTLPSRSNSTLQDSSLRAQSCASYEVGAQFGRRAIRRAALFGDGGGGRQRGSARRETRERQRGSARRGSAGTWHGSAARQRHVPCVCAALFGDGGGGQQRGSARRNAGTAARKRAARQRGNVARQRGAATWDGGGGRTSCRRPSPGCRPTRGRKRSSLTAADPVTAGCSPPCTPRGCTCSH